MVSEVAFGQYPPARRTLVHISDTHLLAQGQPLAGRYDAAVGLTRTLAEVERLGIQPAAIVFTGDLTDLGEPEAYQNLRAAVGPVAERLDAPVVWVAGNHDERPALHQELFDRDGGQAPVTGVWDLAGLRLIVVDTSVPGWHHGEVDQGQLDWLAAELSTPAPLGSVIAMHHPPLPSHIPFFEILELRDQNTLAAVLAGSDVRAILAGHLHYSTFGMFAGIPVSVSSATCYSMNLARPASEVNGMDAAQAFSLVHVYDDTITHAVVPVVDAPTADLFTAEWVATMASLSPQQRLEAFSRKPGR